MIIGQITPISITGEYIKLEQFLKFADIVNSGGEAKVFLLSEEIYVNGELENRRGRKLYKGDQIQIGEEVYKIC